MADIIKLLPPNIANQIAAGEVVNRPSSIVKEMVENSIDAGATAVSVNFREGGRDLIQIVDDGSGLSPQDARLAFERHATSKISSAEDLYALHTFGFRGEALASIAAVAQVELRTRRREDQLGTETIIHGGEFCSQSPIPCKEGTEFLVRNLFYNIPARRKFMNKASTTAREIKSEFQRLAICYPTIRFDLYAEDAPTYRLPPSSLLGRIVDVVGRTMRDKLMHLDANTSIVKLSGFIGKPSAAKRTKAEQYLYVNGRYFRSPKFTQAVLRGYGKLLGEGMNPSYFIFMEIAPDMIDVNVHPQKIEIKFAEEDAIFQIIHAAVRETLAKSGSVPMMEFDEQHSIDIPVLKAGASYAEPRASSSNSEYNPFNDSYIDHTAPNPSVDFTGFDVPYEAPAQPPVERLRDSAHSAFEYFEAERFESIAATPMPEPTMEIESEGFTMIESESDSELQSPEPQFAESEFEIIESVESPKIEIFDNIKPVEGVTTMAGGYVSALVAGEMMIFDIRRAKERVLYNYHIKMRKEGGATCQRLLFPEWLELDNNSYDTLRENIAIFSELGFELVAKDDGVVEINGIPADTTPDVARSLVEELIHAASAEQVLNSRAEHMARVVAQSGARGAQRLNAEQAAEIISELIHGHYPELTPSGKSISTRIGAEEIKSRLN